MKLRAIFLLAAVLSAPGAGAQETPVLKVRLGVNTTASQAAFNVGQRTGIFKKYGFEVEVLPLASGVQSNQALAAGQVDWSGGGIESTVIGWATGLPFKAYAMYAKGGDSYGILVRTESHITGPEDFKGKTFAVPQGTAPAEGLNEVMQRAGLAPGSVRLVNATYGTMGQMLVQGAVDGMVGVEPFLSLTKETMGDNASLLMRLGTYVQGGGFFLISDTWAKGHPEKIRDAVAALWESEQWLRNHETEGARMQAEFLKVDPRLVELSFKWLRFDPLVDDFTRMSIEKTSDFLTRENLILGKVDSAIHLEALYSVTGELRRLSPALLD